MTTTDRGARLRAVKLAGAAAAALALPSTQASAADPPSPRATALRAPIAGHLTVAGQMRAAARAYEQRRLMRVADELGKRAHVRVSRPRLRGDSPATLRARIARLRRELRAQRTVEVPAPLQAIAACESGGDPRAIGGGGLYRGKYQFSVQTWASVGGSGDPAAAPEAEQDMRAARLYARAGAAPWPVCGR
jgi:Transglycosylase-like domain